MEKIIIGSLNVYRNYMAKEFTSYNEYKVMRCVDIGSFRAFMSGAAKSDMVIVSVIENFITNEGEKLDSHDYEEVATDDKINNVIKGVVDQYVTIIKEASDTNPDSRYAIVRPIMRPGCGWYQVKLPLIRKVIDDGIKAINKKNVSRVDAITIASQQFEEDGVHLTKTSGRIFIEGLLSGSDSFFVDNPIRTNSATDSCNPEGDGNDANRRITLLEAEMKARKNNDNLLFARIREELDAISNIAKEDRIIMTGITSKTPPPTGAGPRKDWLNQIVSGIFNEIDPSFKGKILFINQGRNSGKDIPMVKIRMESKEAAARIWKAYADKRKAGTDFGRLFVANCVGLATRVRVDVMKSIAAKLNNSDQAAYVTAFTSRPILYIKPKSGNQKPMAYTFGDEVERYGDVVREDDLGEAYRRSGNSFKGQLEQHFVVLKEGVQVRPPPQPKGKPADAKKRKADDT
jgi:hypothetical protein